MVPGTYSSTPERLPDTHEGIYGLIANAAVLVTVSLLIRPQSAERVRTYVEA